MIIVIIIIINMIAIRNPTNMQQQASTDSKPKRCRAIEPASLRHRINAGMQ